MTTFETLKGEPIELEAIEIYSILAKDQEEFKNFIEQLNTNGLKKLLYCFHALVSKSSQLLETKPRLKDNIFNELTGGN